MRGLHATSTASAACQGAAAPFLRRRLSRPNYLPTQRKQRLTCYSAGQEKERGIAALCLMQQCGRKTVFAAARQVTSRCTIRSPDNTATMRRSLQTLSYLKACARQAAGATSSTGISCGCATSMQHSFTSALHSSQATSSTRANNFHGRFSAGSTRSVSSATATTSSIKRQALVNKLLYRSRQRGFLELDLMMGLWAEKELPRMSEEMLQHFTRRVASLTDRVVGLPIRGCATT